MKEFEEIVKEAREKDVVLSKKEAKKIENRKEDFLRKGIVMVNNNDDVIFMKYDRVVRKNNVEKHNYIMPSFADEV